MEKHHTVNRNFVNHLKNAPMTRFSDCLEGIYSDILSMYKGVYKRGHKARGCVFLSMRKA